MRWISVRSVLLILSASLLAARTIFTTSLRRSRRPDRTPGRTPDRPFSASLSARITLSIARWLASERLRAAGVAFLPERAAAFFGRAVAFLVAGI